MNRFLVTAERLSVMLPVRLNSGNCLPALTVQPVNTLAKSLLCNWMDFQEHDL